jgi:hypothetical protein
MFENSDISKEKDARSISTKRLLLPRGDKQEKPGGWQNGRDMVRDSIYLLILLLKIDIQVLGPMVIQILVPVVCAKPGKTSHWIPVEKAKRRPGTKVGFRQRAIAFWAVRLLGRRIN